MKKLKTGDVCPIHHLKVCCGRMNPIISGQIELKNFKIIQYMDMTIRIQWNLEGMDVEKDKFEDVIAKFYDKLRKFIHG